jgi:hypothetical protein
MSQATATFCVRTACFRLSTARAAEHRVTRLQNPSLCPGNILAETWGKGVHMPFRTILALIALSVSTTATAKQADPKTTKQDDDLKPLTVVGCLQPGAQANQFVLAATPDAMAKGVAVATSGAVPNVTYLLSGGTNLAAHVGHRVEITGRTSGQAQKAESADSKVTRERVPDKPDPKVETKEKASIEMRDLRIESLKMVSTSCAAK